MSTSSKFDRYLNRGEVVVQEFVQPAWISCAVMPVWWFTCFMLYLSGITIPTAGLVSVLLFLISLSAIAVLSPFRDRASNDYAITNQRIIRRYGLFSSYLQEIPLGNVLSIDANSYLLDFLFKPYGTVTIKAFAGEWMRIIHVREAFEFRRVLQDHLMQHRAGAVGEFLVAQAAVNEAVRNHAADSSPTTPKLTPVHAG